MHDPDLEQAIYDYLETTGVWTTLERTLTNVNQERKRKRKKAYGADDVMLALGELVRRRVLMFEFHTGDAMYTIRPGATL